MTQTSTRIVITAQEQGAKKVIEDVAKEVDGLDAKLRNVGVGYSLGSGLRDFASSIGGPWLDNWFTLPGLITAGVTALVIFTKSETQAERQARELGVTLGSITSQFSKFSSETIKAYENLDKLTDTQVTATIQKAERLREFYAQQAETLRLQISQAGTMFNETNLGIFGSVISGERSFDNQQVQRYYEQFQQLRTNFQDGRMEASEYALAIGILRQQLGAMGNKEATELSQGLGLAETAATQLYNTLNSLGKLQLPSLSTLFNQSVNDFLKNFQGQTAKLYSQTSESRLETLQRGVQQAQALYLLRPQKEADAILKKARDDLKAYQDQLAKTAAGPQSGRKNTTATAIDQVTDAINKLTMSAQEYERTQLDKKIATLAGQGVPQNLLDQLRGATENSWAKKQQQEADKAAKQTLQTQESFWDAYSSLGGRNQEAYLQAQEKALQKQVELYRKAGIDITDLEEYAYQKRLSFARDWQSGVIRGLQDYSREAQNAAKNAESALTTAFSSAEDALVQFTTTGKVSFSDLVNSMVADMARLAIRQSITGPLSSALGSAFSSFFGSGSTGSGMVVTPLYSAKGNVFPSRGLDPYVNEVINRPTAFPFAKGGVPRMGIMGEAGPEAVMPLVRDPSGNLGVRAQAAAPVVNVNVINNTQARVETQTSQDAGGNLTLDVIIDELDARMSKRVADGSSQLGNAFDRTRGTNRAAQLYRK